MKTTDFSYFIERYIAGEMSEAENKWFRKELDGNDKLRNEVSLRKQTDDILKRQDVILLRNKLAAIEKQRESIKQPAKVSKKTIYIRYAAIFAGLALIGSLIMFSGGNLTSEKIMKQYNKAYEPPTGQRSANSVTDAEFTLAMEFYNTHDYEKAATLFSKVLESKPNDMQTVLLQGVSNFEGKKYQQAEKSFGRVIDDKDNLYIDQAEWYLALCYLNTDEKDRAKQLFKEIAKEGGVYKNAANKIARGLK